MNKPIPQTYSMETERLRFRSPSKADIPHVFEALHSEGFMDGMTWEAPETKEALEPSLVNIHAKWQEGSSYTFSSYLKQNSDFVGRVGIRTSEKAGVWVISFYIHPKYQKQGFATEAACKILDFGFTELEAQNIEAYHAVFNKASQSVIEKIGMSVVEHISQSFKKRGRWVADNRLSISKEAWEHSTTT